MASQRRRTARDARRRQLGQNFLHDQRAIARVLAIADPRPGDHVIELCAGTGALTRHLAARHARVLAVELDPHWSARLRRSTADLDGVEVRTADALTMDLPHTPFRVVGNPPFNIGTRLLRRLLTADAPLQDATVVLQIEAARRLAGQPATGRFSLSWAPWFEATVVDRIDRRAFRPVPRVDAGIMRVHPRPVPWLSPARFAAWDGFVAAVFEADGRTAIERLHAVLGPRRTRRLPATTRRALAQPPSGVQPVVWATVFRSDQRA